MKTVWQSQVGHCAWSVDCGFIKKVMKALVNLKSLNFTIFIYCGAIEGVKVRDDLFILVFQLVIKWIFLEEHFSMTLTKLFRNIV